MKCPECLNELEYMATWDGRSMYLCNECLSTWKVVINETGEMVKIERYFFG